MKQKENFMLIFALEHQPFQQYEVNGNAQNNKLALLFIGIVNEVYTQHQDKTAVSRLKLSLNFFTNYKYLFQKFYFKV